MRWRARSGRTTPAAPGLATTILALACAGLSSGCGTLANGRGWGQDATVAPGWQRAGTAAWNAAVAPETWIPAAAALAFRIGHTDRRLAEWAARETPVFGSQDHANHMSDTLRRTAGLLWIGSAIAAPSGDTPDDWWLAKARGLAVQAGEGAAARQTVGLLKRSVGRIRPNGGTWSFPSLHATSTASYATLAARNAESLGWSSEAITATRWSLGALTGLTAWSRLEANQHYPSDVLAGIALGHFVASFFNDAFMGLDGQVQVELEFSRKAAHARIRIGF